MSHEEMRLSKSQANGLLDMPGNAEPHAGQSQGLVMGDYRTPEFNGTIARLAMQCTHPVLKKTGTWLFTGDSHRIVGSGVSPLFADCLECFEWARNNNFEPCGVDFIYRGNGTHGKTVSAYMEKHYPNIL